MAVAEEIESLQVSILYPGSQITRTQVPCGVAITTGPLEAISGGIQIRTHIVLQIAMEASAGLPPLVIPGECAMHKQCAVACFAPRRDRLRSSHLAKSRVLRRDARQCRCRNALHKRIFAP